jgi:hypothetical protein
VLPRAGALPGEQVCIDRCVEGEIVELEREIVSPLLRALDQEGPISSVTCRELAEGLHAD